ncbi:MAG: PAS domain S-box protein, partial [Rhodomicrobium sp.]|nr:PAS domain S-box protein [Rhodomicrobium sp.]
MGWESLVPRYAAAVRSGVGGALGGRLKRWFSASRFSRWTIAARIAAIVLTLAVPLNLIVVAVVWHLADAASEAQRKSLLYTSRSVAATADAELGKYMALAQSLARSPALLDDNLAPFEAEARRAFASLPDAWVVVADLNGQQLINTASQPGQPLPPSDPACTTAQKRALETGSIVLTDVRMSPVLQDWVVSIDVPIFRDGQPLRALAIVTKAHSFLRLLSDQQIPKNWLAGILDSQGRFIARVPGDARYIGQLAPQGFRKVKDRDGIFEFVSMEGDPIVAANAHSLSGWPVAIAIKKAELQAMTWSTVRWAAILGGGLSVLSLLFACAISRRITGPITELRQKAAALLTGPACPMPPGPPEVRDLWEALRQVATNRHRNEQALRESREDLSRAQAVARIGSWRLDASRNELTWSTEAFHIFGVSPDEPLTYESLLASVHPDDRGHVDRNWKAALAGAPYDLEYRIAAGGKTKWVHARAELELDAAGKLLGGFGTVQDITDMKQAEEELLRQRHLTHMIGDRAADAIFLTDEAGHITYANPEAEGSFGYERREMMGRDLHELLHHHFEGGARYPTDDCVLSRVQEKGAPVRNHEDVFYRKDASPIEVSFSYAPLEQDGKRAGGVFVVRDITAQKAAQAALRE